MPYITPGQSKWDAKCDLAGVSRDLCAAMGGQAVSVSEDGNRATFLLGQDSLTLGYGYADLSKVRASISAADVTPEEARQVYGGSSVNASFNPDGRSMAAIARDLKRRVVDPAQEGLADLRRNVTKLKRERAEMAVFAVQIESLGLRVSLDSCGTHGSAHSQADDYLRLSLKHDCAQIERTGDLSFDKLSRILAILREA